MQLIEVAGSWYDVPETLVIRLRAAGAIVETAGKDHRGKPILALNPAHEFSFEHVEALLDAARGM